MARLSRKQSVHVSFMLHKLAASYDQQQRDELLAALLDSLHIDDDQRRDSAASARRSLRYDADKKRQRPAKQADDIDNMSHDEVRRYIDELYAKRDALLAQRAKPVDQMSDEERAAYQDYLLRKLQGATTPEPAPIVEEAPRYDVTAKQRRRLAAFEDMTDADQVDALKSLWGAA